MISTLEKAEMRLNLKESKHTQQNRKEKIMKKTASHVYVPSS